MYDPIMQPSEIYRELIKQDMLNSYHDKRKDYIESIRSINPEVTPKGEHFETFDVKDAVVWIDPLDGTNDFVRGNLTAVTVLIGLSLNGISRLGVVHNPFTDEDASKGRTLFGTIEHGLFNLDYEETMSIDAYK
jgi:3'-phosphoadenosine 5'-phosphosulfate (PAPS) 3'-phosphatase